MIVAHCLFLLNLLLLPSDGHQHVVHAARPQVAGNGDFPQSQLAASNSRAPNKLQVHPFIANQTTVSSEHPEALRSRSQPSIRLQSQADNSGISLINQAVNSPRLLQQQPQATGIQSNSLSSVRYKWRQMELSLSSNMKTIANQLRVTLFEELLSQDKRLASLVSANCQTALQELLVGLEEQRLWASQMVDSSARLPAGLLEGTLTELGNFDECLAISYNSNNKQQPQQQQPDQRASGGRAASTSGQYCSLLIKPPLIARPRLHTACRRLQSLSGVGANQTLSPMSQNSHQFYYAGLRLGICTPSKCSQADLQHLLSAHLLKFELIGQVRACQAGSSTTTTTRAVSSQDAHSGGGGGGWWWWLPVQFQWFANLDRAQQAILFVFGLLLFVTLLGTFLDKPQLRDCCATLALNGKRQTMVDVHGDFSAGATATTMGKGGTGMTSTGNRRQWQQYQVYRGTNSAAGTSSCSELRFANQQSDSDDHFNAPGPQVNPLMVSGSADGGCGSQKESAPAKSQLVDQAVSRARKDVVPPCLPAPNAKPTAAAAATGTHDFASSLCWRQAGNKCHFGRVDCGGQMCANIATGTSCVQPTNWQPRAFSSFRMLLICFSLKSNLRSIGKLAALAPKQNQQKLGANGSESATVVATESMADIKVVHGLRTLAMIWIIFGHTIGLVNPEMMNNLFALAQLSCSSRALQALLNATLAVNTFFMISGFVTAVSVARKCRGAIIPSKNNISGAPGANGSRQTTEGKIIGNTSKGARQGRTINGGRDVESSLETLSSSSSCSDSVSSSITSLDSTSSSNRCIGLAIQKQQQHRTPSIRPAASLHNKWPDDFRPLLWLAMRYLRLTPSYAATIGLCILMPALGSGPFWQESVGTMSQACQQNWWTNLVYVNNFVATDKLCLIHSWYLSNDWQFFLMALLLFGVHCKSRKLTLVLLISTLLASSAATFAITVQNEFPPTIVTTSPAVAERWLFIHSLYYKPWPHLPSYLVGLCTGYLITHRHQHQRSLGGGLRLLCWLLFTLIGLAVLNSIYPWNMGLQVDPIITGLHSATFRTLWAACCAWLVYALVTRPRNPLALLLSWHGFQVTSRLTYCAYLVHPLVIYYHFGTLRERIDSSPYGQVHRFMATLALSYLFAFLLSLFVESPSIKLQRWLVGCLIGGVGSNGQNVCANNYHKEWQQAHQQLQVVPGPPERLRACSAMPPLVLHSSTSRGRSSSVSGLVQPKEASFACWASNSSNASSLSTGQTSAESLCGPAQRQSPSAQTSYENLGPQQQQRQPPMTTATATMPTAGQAHSLAAIPEQSTHKRCRHASGNSASDHGALEEAPATTSNKSGRPKSSKSKTRGASATSPQTSGQPLDEEFQQKLAQAIGRGFKMRTRANGAATLRPALSTMAGVVAPARHSSQAKYLPASSETYEDFEQAEAREHCRSVSATAATAQLPPPASCRRQGDQLTTFAAQPTARNPPPPH